MFLSRGHFGLIASVHSLTLWHTSISESKEFDFSPFFYATTYPSVHLSFTSAYLIIHYLTSPLMYREKPEHSSGGRWRLCHTDIRGADYLWCELAISAVGEKLDQLVDSHNSVKGVGDSPRPAGVVIDIWTASLDFDPDQTTKFAQRLNDLILPQLLAFKLISYESKLLTILC